MNEHITPTNQAFEALLDDLAPEAKAFFSSLAHKNATLEKEVQNLKWQLEEFRRLIYGKKSEKFILSSANQPSLFGQPLPSVEKPASETVIPEHTRKKKKPSKDFDFQGRFPDDIPREDAGVITLEEEKQACPCCQGPREVFSYRTCERLAYKCQRSLVVNVYQIPTYRCGSCKDEIISPPAPPTPLDNIQVESSFLAYIYSEKFEYGLPLYRIERRLLTEKLPISRTTLCEYQQKGALLLTPLVEFHKKNLTTSTYIHIDETHWKVAQVIEGKKKYKRAWGWMFLSKEGDVLFEYGVARTKDSVEPLLGEYHGTIVCDGEDHYDHYRLLYEQNGDGVSLARCNSHARRKFDAAKKSHYQQAERALTLYAFVYNIERKIKEEQADNETILRYRRCSLRVLRWLKERCEQWQLTALPKSPLRKAASYFLNFYDDLTYYCSHPEIPIDNNPCERMVRKFVIGRKAWLFSSSEEGAASSAVIYSLVLTCMENNIPVREYLTDVIHRIGVEKDTDYHSMLPRVWWEKRKQKNDSP